VIRRLGWFLGATLALWLVVVIPVRYAWSTTQAVYSGCALAICLVPATGTLAWSIWGQRQSPGQQMVAVLGGTAVRLLAVFAAGLVLYQRVEYFQKEPGFWTWVLVFYLLTLALEVAVLLTGRPAGDR
jgi:hypothetical protein